MHPKRLTLFLTIALLTSADRVGADMVILKSGEMFQTSQAWRENGIVCYFQDGQVVRVDGKAVERLIPSPAPVDPPPPREPRPAADPPSSSDTPAAGRPLPSTSPTGDEVGYLGLRWDQPLSQVDGLALVGTDPAYGGVQQYARKEREKRFGRARVDNIFFGFWQGGLYTILIETGNVVDFMDLKAEAFRRFGEVRREGDHQEKYRWTGKGSDRLLAFDYHSDTGYLWMRSQTLHEKVKARYPQE